MGQMGYGLVPKSTREAEEVCSYPEPGSSPGMAHHPTIVS